MKTIRTEEGYFLSFTCCNVVALVERSQCGVHGVISFHVFFEIFFTSFFTFHCVPFYPSFSNNHIIPFCWAVTPQQDTASRWCGAIQCSLYHMTSLAVLHLLTILLPTLLSRRDHFHQTHGTLTRLNHCSSYFSLRHHEMTKKRIKNAPLEP